MLKSEGIDIEKCYKCDILPGADYKEGKIRLRCRECGQDTEYRTYVLSAVGEWNDEQKRNKKDE